MKNSHYCIVFRFVPLNNVWQYKAKTKRCIFQKRKWTFITTKHTKSTNKSRVRAEEEEGEKTEEYNYDMEAEEKNGPKKISLYKWKRKLILKTKTSYNLTSSWDKKKEIECRFIQIIYDKTKSKINQNHHHLHSSWMDTKSQ